MLHHRWTYKVDTDSLAIIIPDGCCDIIVVSSPDQDDEFRFSSWDFRPRKVWLEAGSKMVGYRLRPGVVVDLSLEDIRANSGISLEELIDDLSSRDEEVRGIIDFLSNSNATVENAARQSGVTVRTLQRRFRNQNLPPPDHWRLLGRARRAVQDMPYCVPLAEIACEYGYSDQAHMTREMVRWFGLPPAQLRKSKTLLDEIFQPGLGNWSSEGRSTSRACFK